MTKVLIASRVSGALGLLQKCFAGQSDFEAHVRLINNGHADPLHGLAFQPDIVVLRFDAEHLKELAAWTVKDKAVRPPLIVVGPAAQPEAMRLAIRSGAKDFLAEPVTAADLIAALVRVRDESRALSKAAAATGTVHAIVGASGGAGASFVAANLARILAGTGERPAAAAPMLIDLDLNFAPLAHYLDLHPERGLLQALDAVAGLDEHALAGFGATHHSGLRLLCATGIPAVLSKDVSAEQLSLLIDMLARHHPHVLVDVPHVLDSLTATVFGLAEHIVLVLQQSVLHVRNAARLLQILRIELGIAPERIRVVVNRHQKDALVQLDDIRRSLNVATVLTVPSHYRSALESTDTGVPLYDAEPHSSVVRALRTVASALSGEATSPRGGMLRRVLPSFLRN